MASLAQFSLKDAQGNWKNYTIAINDTTDNYGNNIVIYETQSKEERASKAKKKYFANGKVFWTDGKVTLAEKKEQQKTDANEDLSELPF